MMNIIERLPVTIILLIVTLTMTAMLISTLVTLNTMAKTAEIRAMEATHCIVTTLRFPVEQRTDELIRNVCGEKAGI